MVQSSNGADDARDDDESVLTDDELNTVAGGLNPQPFPPSERSELSS